MQDLEYKRLQTDTFLEFARIVAVEHQRLKEHFAAEGLDITPGQSRALMILFQAGEPLTARELSGRLGASEVTVSRFVKALCSAEWVQRKQDEQDKRAYRLCPTRRAYDALPAFVRVSNAMLDKVFGGLDRPDLEQLAGLLGRIRTNLDG